MSAYPPLAIGLLVAALANLLVYFFSPFLLRSRWNLQPGRQKSF
jgi:hypothetical protein